MCPQELVLGLKKVRRVKEMFNSLQSPASPPQFFLPVFSYLPLEHFDLNLLLIAFILPHTRHQEPAASQVDAEDGNPSNLATCVAPDFFYYI